VQSRRGEERIAGKEREKKAGNHPQEKTIKSVTANSKKRDLFLSGGRYPKTKKGARGWKGGKEGVRSRTAVLLKERGAGWEAGGHDAVGQKVW